MQPVQVRDCLKPIEYELVLPDGSKRYELVDPDARFSVMAQIMMVSEKPRATSAKPVSNESPA